MSRKKVAIMCFSGGSGGMEQDTVKLAALLNTACDVTVFCKKNTFAHKLVKGRGDIDFIAISFASRIFSPSMFFRVRSEVKKKGISNIIYFGASELKTLYFSFIGLQLNIIVRHGTTKSSRKHDWFHRMVYSMVTTHVVLSKHLLENVKDILPFNKNSRYKIIVQSYHFVQTTSHAMRDKKASILHVGRITEGKGQIDLLKACQALYDEGIDFNLTFLGAVEDPDYKLSLDRLLDTVVYRDRVTFAGHVSNVADYLDRSNILVFPSKGEGMPNAVIEALHHGLVCIAYNNTVFPEFREMGFYIHLVDNGDISALGDRLVFVASNIDQEITRAKCNIEKAAEVFSPDREKCDWLSLLM